MSRGAAGAGAKGGKKKTSTFVIDCGKPLEDKIMEIASLEKFLQERIKVGNKAGNLGDSITISREKNKISVTTDSNFSKRTYEYEMKDERLLEVEVSEFSLRNLLEQTMMEEDTSASIYGESDGDELPKAVKFYPK